MEIKKTKFPAYKKILKNNFLNQYYHSVSTQKEEIQDFNRPQTI